MVRMREHSIKSMKVNIWLISSGGERYDGEESFHCIEESIWDIFFRCII